MYTSPPPKSGGNAGAAAVLEATNGKADEPGKNDTDNADADAEPDADDNDSDSSGSRPSPESDAALHRTGTGGVPQGPRRPQAALGVEVIRQFSNRQKAEYHVRGVTSINAQPGRIETGGGGDGDGGGDDGDGGAVMHGALSSPQKRALLTLTPALLSPASGGAAVKGRRRAGKHAGQLDGQGSSRSVALGSPGFTGAGAAAAVNA